MPLFPHIMSLGTRVVEYDSAIYATLQDAVDYCETLTESDVTDTSGVTLIIPTGDFSAQTVLIKKHVHLVGTTGGAYKTRIGTLTYRPTSAALGPSHCVVRYIDGNTLNILAETSAGSGVFNPDIFDVGLEINNGRFNSVVGNRILSIWFKDCINDGVTHTYHYCSRVEYLRCYTGTVVWHQDDSVANLPTGYAQAAFYITGCPFMNADVFKDAGTEKAFIGIQHSYVDSLIVNGNCDIAARDGCAINKDGYVSNGTGNTFVTQESWNVYNPTTPGNWTAAPIWVRDALDELAARPSLGNGDKGDVTVSGGGATWTIDNNVVSNAKLADVPTQTFKGRTTAATGDPEDLTIAQAKTLLDLTGTNSGDQTITLTTDVTGSGTGSFAATIANNAVTNAKAADMAANSIKGNNTGAPADPVDLTATQVRTLINVADGANNYVHPNHSGDVTSVADGAQTIVNDAVTNAKAANVPTATIKGRVTAATGDPEDLTTAQATTLIDAFTSGLKGSAPASGGGTTNFLRADGTWAAPAAGSGYNQINDEANPLTQRTTISFAGAGVSAADSGGITVVTIPGGAGSGATGTTTVDFGAFPGKSDTSVAVTGQASIVAGSIVNAWIRPVATADHLADEHLVETIKIIAGNIVAATGFTIYAFNTSEINEKPSGNVYEGTKAGSYGKGTRIYGLWTVQWKWE